MREGSRDGRPFGLCFECLWVFTELLLTYLEIIWENELPTPEIVEDVSEEDAIPVNEDSPPGVL